MTTQSRNHRPQEERRAETRGKLLDATIKSVLEVGYAQTTTRRVAELAGVSGGARAHHFPHRVDLFGAAIESLAERRLAEFANSADALPADPRKRLDVLLDIVWEDFSSPLFIVVIKLWVAAADEPELYERLAISERRIARSITQIASAGLGDLGVADHLEELVVLFFSSLRGLALTQQFEPRTRRQRDQWQLLKRALLRAAGV